MSCEPALALCVQLTIAPLSARVADKVASPLFIGSTTYPTDPLKTSLGFGTTPDLSRSLCPSPELGVVALSLIRNMMYIGNTE